MGRTPPPIPPLPAGFPPQSGRLGLDRSGLSPGGLAKEIHAGANLPSFAAASDALSVLAEVNVPAKMVERRVREIGTARCGDTAADLAVPLTERKGTPVGVVAPDLAVVQMDGGRLPIFDRTAEEGEAQKTAGRFWQEDKVGLLASMTSAALGRPLPGDSDALP